MFPHHPTQRVEGRDRAVGLLAAQQGGSVGVEHVRVAVGVIDPLEGAVAAVGLGPGLHALIVRVDHAVASVGRV
jgi:hypothetical protein